MLPAAGSPVPANLPGFHWQPDGDVPSIDDTHATLQTAGGEPVAVTLESFSPQGWVVRPQAPLAPNTDYELVLADFCSGSGEPDETGLSFEFHAVDAAQLPTVLGELSIGPPVIGSVTLAEHTGGFCDSQYDAVWVDVELDLHEGAQPWDDVLFFETFVDDEPWHRSSSSCEYPSPGESWIGRGRDKVYLLCDGGDEERSVTIEMRAYIPGADVELATPAAEVTLRCGEAAGTGSTTGIPSTTADPEPTTSNDPADPGATTTGDPGADDLVTDRGCSCRAQPRTPSPRWLLALVLLARRRRHTSPRP